MFPEISPPFVLQWRSRRLVRPESVEWIAATRGAGARNPVASVAPEISRRRQNATRSCPVVAARSHADQFQVIALHFRFAAARSPEVSFPFRLENRAANSRVAKSCSRWSRRSVYFRESAFPGQRNRDRLVQPPGQNHAPAATFAPCAPGGSASNARTVLRPGEWCEMPRALPRRSLAERPVPFARSTAT